MSSKHILKCLVVDDEHMARKLLEENISQISFLKHIASCKNSFEAMEALKSEEIDLMFLDIQMPGLLGTKFLESLDKRPMTIFVTAYPQYALEGFDLEALDYLMKPVSMPRFIKSVNKALKIYETNAKINDLTNDKNLPSKSSLEAGDDFFFVHVEYSLVKIYIKDVLYVEGMKDYVKIYLTNQRKRVITKSSLTAMEGKLSSGNFMRIHKSYIANLNEIKSIRNHMIKLEDTEIPVSPSKLTELLRQIGFES